MTNYCYLNGKIITCNKAKVSVNDIGILRGFGIFDFLRSHKGRPFLLEKHLGRLEKSAELLNLKVPLSKKEIRGVIEELLKKNKLSEASIRIVLTGGQSVDGLSYDYDSPTFFILVKELQIYPPSIYKKGVKLITFEHQREMPEAKTNNYITMLRLKKFKEKKKAFEILYVSRGLVLEGTTCNFFIFKKNTLITPKSNILYGTRRNLVINLAKNKFKVAERALRLKEIKEATEAFITSTNRNIVPVVRIDDNKVGDGKVGKNTSYLMDLFNEYFEKYSRKICF